jgi:hypothetical protein
MERMDQAQSPVPVKHFPLRILVIGWHEHNPGYGTMALMNHFREHQGVVSFGTVERLELASSLISKGLVNTVFLDLRIGRYYGSPEDYGGPDQVDPSIRFIEEVRREYPSLAFVLFTDPMMRDAICRVNTRFQHYFYLENGYSERVRLSKDKIDATLAACAEWHRSLFSYDVAISFAGTDREQARQLSRELTAAGACVFFDEDAEGFLLGKDLFVTLHEIYSERSRFCVMLVSRAYAARMWTVHERRAAQERTLRERGAEYILPVRIDETKLPGLPSTIGYISLSEGIGCWGATEQKTGIRLLKRHRRERRTGSAKAAALPFAPHPGRKRRTALG